MRYLKEIVIVTFGCLFISACSFNKPVSREYTLADSTYVVEDTNNYGCKPPSKADVEHILNTSVNVTDRDIHDYYLIVGCSITGTLLNKGTPKSFTLDLGGIIYLNDGTRLACAEDCCADPSFEYCTYEE